VLLILFIKDALNNKDALNIIIKGALNNKGALNIIIKDSVLTLKLSPDDALSIINDPKY